MHRPPPCPWRTQSQRSCTRRPSPSWSGEMVRSWVQRVCALLRLVAPAAHGSEHPLAAAIVQAATERGLTMAAAEGFAAVTGTGMTTRVDGREVLVGNGALLSEQPIDAGTVVERAASWRRGARRPWMCG